MGKPYSMDLRERVIAAIEGGESTGEAAKRFAIGKATAGAWARLKRATGGVKAAPARQAEGFGAGRPCRLHLRADRGSARHHAGGDRGPCRQRARCSGGVDGGVEVPRSLRHDTQKKTAHASEQERADVKAARRAWFARQPELDPAHLFFVDESGLSTKMARLRGWAPRGERCRASFRTAIGRQRPSSAR